MTNAELAEMLMGIARTQKALVDAIGAQLGDPVNLRGTHVIPALQSLTGVRQQQPVTLGTLHGRILLLLQAGGADQAGILTWVEGELNRLTQPHP